MNKYEEDLACNTLHPSEIDARLEDIGGHEHVLKRLLQITNLLLDRSQAKHLSSQPKSRLFTVPMGILLYGPPGCGKTLIAKALAKESGVRFLSLNLATILDKWVGETEKYLEALFSLAHKAAPMIVFIDEIDALTRKRTAADRDWSSAMKSQLLTLWDGLAHNHDRERVVIMGATNRPGDIDEAFLRRMPLQIKVDLPSATQRRQILEIFVNDLEVSKDAVDIDLLAQETEGMSGSDLHELCRRTVLHSQLVTGNLQRTGNPLGTIDFLEQLQNLQIERVECRLYPS